MESGRVRLLEIYILVVVVAVEHVQLSYDALGTTANDGVQFGIQSGGGYIWNFENSSIYFVTNNSERMRIDSSGNVGIGVTNPSGFYANRLVVSAGYADGITIAADNTTDVNFLTFDDVGSASTIGKGWLGYYHNGDSMVFGANGSEAMRINSGQNVAVGGTSFNAYQDGSINTNLTFILTVSLHLL